MFGCFFLHKTPAFCISIYIRVNIIPYTLFSNVVTVIYLYSKTLTESKTDTEFYGYIVGYESISNTNPTCHISKKFTRQQTLCHAFSSIIAACTITFKVALKTIQTEHVACRVSVTTMSPSCLKKLCS